MASNPALITFESREAMAERLADLVAANAVSGPFVDFTGELAVSGGSTPKALYDNLAKRDLPWNSIRLTLVDERWVPANHPRSNESFIRKTFLAAEGVRVTGLYNDAESPRDGVASAIEILDGRQKAFDIVILGMGDDGHTASWFPHAEGLEDALTSDELVCAVTAKKSDVTGEEIERITMTLSAISKSRLIVLLITGDDKRETFKNALEPGPVEDMPVRAILRARPDMWVCWAP